MANNKECGCGKACKRKMAEPPEVCPAAGDFADNTVSAITYPRVRDYRGGGTLYGHHTRLRALAEDCPAHLRTEVMELVCRGYSVVVDCGKIVGVET